MNWHRFIFSDNATGRIKRHLVFWLLWWIYFAATYYYYGQVGLQQITFGDLSGILIIKTFLLLLLHIASCYFFIYVLLPGYLLKRKYFLFSALLLLLTAALLISGYFIHSVVFPIIDKAYSYNLSIAGNTVWWTSVNAVLLNAPKIIAAATAIRLIKRWYLKQKEKERIEQEKLMTDLQLLKTQIRPDFLFSSLEQMYNYTKKKSPEAPKLLLKFSDLLSYMLYECDDIKVALEKEMIMTEEYMLLEKMRHGNSIEMEIGMRGDVLNKEIAPLMLLPFIENSFRHCATVAEQPWINLDINIENGMLTMKLMNGVEPDFGVKEIERKIPEIINVQKRLDLLYGGNHELKMYAEVEIYITVLKINLEGKPYAGASMSRTGIQNQEASTKYAVN